MVQDARFQFRAEIPAELIPTRRADSKADVILDLDSGARTKKFLHVGVVRDFRPDAAAKIESVRTVSAAVSPNRNQRQKTRRRQNTQPNHRSTSSSHTNPSFLVSHFFHRHL